MNKKVRDANIDVDEVFLDSSNLPEFNQHQFEGRLQKPISRLTFFFFGLFLIGILCVGVWRLWSLQVQEGQTYFELGENNIIRHTPIFPRRGVIYDRNERPLAFNVFGSEEDDFMYRKYATSTGIAHVLGYLSYPAKDSSGFYYQKEYIPEGGIELIYNDILHGKLGIKITEHDVANDVTSESELHPAVDGESVILSIDSELQDAIYQIMENVANDVDFSGGGAVIMDVWTGEVLALVSFPEYSLEVMNLREDDDAISKSLSDPRSVFLNRVTSGLYTPGSIVKPYIALGALQEGIIDPQKSILSTGSISIQNPYDPNLKTVFNDWKAHGWIDMRQAIAVSSNVYFYAIGGGYEDQDGLGIERIEKYIKTFGIGQPTGIDLGGEVDGTIPNPEWKKENFDDGIWRIGDTYNTSIGQYGFQVTPIQMVRAVASIANHGWLVTPHLLLGLEEHREKIKEVDTSNFQVIQDGMRLGVTSSRGTARGLDVPFVNVAAKTGTAEVGITKKRVNSWTTGFWPYEKPRFAFVLIMEKGPRDNLVGATSVMRQVLDWMAYNTPKYFESV